MKSVLLQNLLCARTQLREPFVIHALSTLYREKKQSKNFSLRRRGQEPSKTRRSSKAISPW